MKLRTAEIAAKIETERKRVGAEVQKRISDIEERTRQASETAKAEGDLLKTACEARSKYEQCRERCSSVDKVCRAARGADGTAVYTCEARVTADTTVTFDAAAYSKCMNTYITTRFSAEADRTTLTTEAITAIRERCRAAATGAEPAPSEPADEDEVKPPPVWTNPCSTVRCGAEKPLCVVRRGDDGALKAECIARQTVLPTEPDRSSLVEACASLGAEQQDACKKCAGNLLIRTRTDLYACVRRHTGTRTRKRGDADASADLSVRLAAACQAATETRAESETRTRDGRKRNEVDAETDAEGEANVSLYDRLKGTTGLTAEQKARLDAAKESYEKLLAERRAKLEAARELCKANADAETSASGDSERTRLAGELSVLANCGERTETGETKPESDGDDRQRREVESRLRAAVQVSDVQKALEAAKERAAAVRTRLSAEKERAERCQGAAAAAKKFAARVQAIRKLHNEECKPQLDDLRSALVSARAALKAKVDAESGEAKLDAEAKAALRPRLSQLKELNDAKKAAIRKCYARAQGLVAKARADMRAEIKAAECTRPSLCVRRRAVRKCAWFRRIAASDVSLDVTLETLRAKLNARLDAADVSAEQKAAIEARFAGIRKYRSCIEASLERVQANAADQENDAVDNKRRDVRVCFNIAQKCREHAKTDADADASSTRKRAETDAALEAELEAFVAQESGEPVESEQAPVDDDVAESEEAVPIGQHSAFDECQIDNEDGSAVRAEDSNEPVIDSADENAASLLAASTTLLVAVAAAQF